MCACAHSYMHVWRPDVDVMWLFPLLFFSFFFLRQAVLARVPCQQVPRIHLSLPHSVLGLKVHAAQPSFYVTLFMWHLNPCPHAYAASAFLMGTSPSSFKLDFVEGKKGEFTVFYYIFKNPVCFKTASEYEWSWTSILLAAKNSSSWLLFT